jgi:hypothetical protein
MKPPLKYPALLLSVAVLSFAVTGRVVAAGPSLTPTVTPMTGTTATIFVFSTQFHPAGETVTGASVSVAGSTYQLSRSGGPEANQIWSGSHALPEGSWTAVFSGTTVSGTNPTPVSVGPIDVTAPTPTPAPGPPPPPTPVPSGTPRPTPRPTPPSATATQIPGSTANPGGSPTPVGTTGGSPDGSPWESASASAHPGGSATMSPLPADTPSGTGPFDVPAEGVVAMGLLGAVAVAAALGERRRRRAVEAFRATQAREEESPQPAGPEAGWERGAAEDETIATIDYEGLDHEPNG